MQTDELERRFGRYRNLSGCNYKVSYCQILENEKKIRDGHLLQWKFKLSDFELSTSEINFEDKADDSNNRSNFEFFIVIE